MTTPASHPTWYHAVESYQYILKEMHGFQEVDFGEVFPWSPTVPVHTLGAFLFVVYCILSAMG